MLKCPLYILVLEDNTMFQGGTYENTKWSEIPQNKKIKRVFYSLPNSNDYLCLEGYNKYFNMIEATTDINGASAGKVKIDSAYIMGEKDEKITCYKIALQYTGNKKIGDIEKKEYEKTDPFILGLNKNGWK